MAVGVGVGECAGGEGQLCNCSEKEVALGLEW